MKLKQPLDLKLTISKKQFILKIVVDCHMRYIALTLILMLTAGIAGYTIGNLKSTSKGYTSQLTQQNNSQQSNSSPLFQTQSATITGTITSTSAKNLTITDTKNQTGQFMASDKLIVINLDAKPNPASPSSSAQSITLNKVALIQLQMEDGQFKVVSIGYLPNNVPPPPSNP